MPLYIDIQKQRTRLRQCLQSKEQIAAIKAQRAASNSAEAHGTAPVRNQIRCEAVASKCMHANAGLASNAHHVRRRASCTRRQHQGPVQPSASSIFAAAHHLNLKPGGTCTGSSARFAVRDPSSSILDQPTGSKAQRSTARITKGSSPQSNLGYHSAQLAWQACQGCSCDAAPSQQVPFVQASAGMSHIQF